MNLFHSLADFNVPTNNLANFLNSGSVDLNGSLLPSNLLTSNILGRINGGNPSSIFGMIQTNGSGGFPNANLFLMNPNGFLFEPNCHHQRRRDGCLHQRGLPPIFGAGWLIVLVTTFLINHFDLFGLRQVWLYLQRRPYTPLGFVMPGPYRYVRHPLHLGWLFAFWSIPSMTVAHLLFAVATTSYILIAIQLEERDLVTFHGEIYTTYRQRVPMLIPGVRRKQTEGQPVSPVAP